jgi:thiol-disulfide isomerase/thioredoxin
MVDNGVAGKYNSARSGLCTGLISMLLMSMWTGMAMALDRGTVAPEFSLPVLVNASDAQRAQAEQESVHFAVLNLSDYRGRVVYLDFWDSSCLPCRESLPMLSRLREEFARDDVEIVAVNTDSNPNDALSFLAEHPVSYPVVSDPAATTVEAYGSTALPSAYFIARDGTIHGKHQGFKASDIARIRSQLTALSDSDTYHDTYEENRGYK